MSIEIAILEGVEVRVDGNTITVKSGSIELARKFPIQFISVKSANGMITIAESATGRSQARMIVGSFGAHIQNMMQGVKAPYVYKLKVCHIHFPMSLKLEGDKFQVTNCFGEKQPRATKIPKGVDVKIDGEIITVQSPDIELAGLAASRIEQLTKIRNRDRRVFLDGIYITEKAGKPVRC